MFKEIFDKSWELFFRNWKFFISVVSLVLIPALIVDEIFVTRITCNEPYPFLIPRDVIILLQILSVLGMAAGILFYLLIIELSIKEITDKNKCGIRDIYYKGILLLPGYALVKFWTVLYIAKGLLLLIIPGIRAAFLYLFSGMAYVFDDKKGKDALVLSREVANNHLIQIMLFIFTLCSLVFIMFYIVKWVLDRIIDMLLMNNLFWWAKFTDMANGYFIGLAVVFMLISGYYFFQDLKVRPKHRDK